MRRQEPQGFPYSHQSPEKESGQVTEGRTGYALYPYLILLHQQITIPFFIAGFVCSFVNSTSFLLLFALPSQTSTPRQTRALQNFPTQAL